MKVLILAAGYGTRLYPLTKDKPKALLLLKDRPLINYLLDKVQGFEELSEVIVVSNERFYKNFKEWADAQTAYSKPIQIISDGTKTNDDRLGSIGDINFVLEKDNITEDLLVLGGDNIFDFDLNEYMVFAKAKSPQATIGLYDIKSMQEAKLFGVVALDLSGRVISFEEKPMNPESSLISMCLYYFPKESLHFIADYISQTKTADTAGGYIRWFAGEDTVYGFSFNGKWYDIGSIEAYQDAQENFTP